MVSTLSTESEFNRIYLAETETDYRCTLSKIWPPVSVGKIPVDGLEGGVDEGGTGSRDEAENGKDPAHLLLSHALARHRPGMIDELH